MSNGSRILAIGGAQLGPTSTDWPLHQFLLDLTGRERPRICFVGTASGDDASGLASFYATFSRSAISRLLMASASPGVSRSASL